jgi:ATPase family associated with various cellular activities (AAA)
MTVLATHEPAQAPTGRAQAPTESLTQALARVYRALTAHLGAPAASERPSENDALRAGNLDLDAWHPFAHLSELFALTPFERDLLILCTGFELERRFIAAAGAAVAEDGGRRPTFALAMTVLDDPHWSAVTPGSPLRYWRLLELGGGNLLDAPLQLDERLLEFVLGVPAMDARLQPLVRPVVPIAADAPRGDGANEAHGSADEIGSGATGRAREQRDTIALGVRHWGRSPAPREPLLLLDRHPSSCRRVFARMCRELGLTPYSLDAADLPADAVEREHHARLWTREAILSGAALYLRTERCEDIANVTAWLEAVRAPVAIEVTPGALAERLEGVRMYLSSITARERHELWSRDLGALAERMDGQLERIAEYFDFDEPAIRLTATRVLELTDGDERVDPGQLCWRACREHSRRSLEGLAQRVDVTATWGDLVLPDAQARTLRQIATHVRRRAIVNDRWGFAGKHARGLGLTVLFAGSSGTGKTMAAEALAAELDLDLYRVDLASVVSKWIGETEKNLRAVFDGAAQSGAVLLFDEADALFGKRSEVRDSHDRFANLEIGYLLQQMEAYRGVAILTTNMQHALDAAFMRRIRFVVQFPFPDHAARAEIWRRIFPAGTPLAELDHAVLAQLNVSGGVIRNIALGAAFLAAEDSQLVEPRHILGAAHTEYGKLDKPLTAAETRGLS